MMATGKIPRSMAWAWSVQPDTVWKEAIRNKVHDQREVKGNDTLRIAEQARELYTRRIAAMLLPYEIAQNIGAGKVDKKPLKAEQKSESLKTETGAPPAPSNAGQQRLQQIASLKSEIASLNSDLNDLTGWFKGKQRRELTERIETKKAELKRLEQQ